MEKMESQEWLPVPEEVEGEDWELNSKKKIDPEGQPDLLKQEIIKEIKGFVGNQEREEK